MWENLTKTQKVLIVLAIGLLVAFVPEMMLLMELGGVEMVFTLLLFYFSFISNQLHCKFRHTITK